MKHSIFPSKILLFGEYGVLENYCGLSIPYDFYQGILKFGNNIHHFHSNQEMKKFYNFLSLSKKHSSFKMLHLKNFSQDLEKGIYFHSNIPQKCGLGSSGALVASIYDRYSRSKKNVNEIKDENLLFFTKIFSDMESFFHEKSSGLDPLICYFNKPFLIYSKNKISTIQIPKKNKKGKGAIFLLNSERKGETRYMIKFFLKKLKNNTFKKNLKKEFVQYNQKCIKFFLEKDFQSLLHCVKKISIWIFDNLYYMIPKNFIKIWKEGIYNDFHYMKLCGSGGGGFTLVFSPNYELSIQKLKKYQTKIIFQF
ncbi:mevalonate kinase family protein [Blattabacterium cuenoti]|uniref:mevalonate kinase family protein n=1 Tax=Blattabacterium cuenoti TaxID=1653831 RepID=UPI00163C0DEC|nr:mevalonate kinase [Blattabacterium cuenoti]